MNTKILIVEDEGLIAIDLKRKLEKSGYSVPVIAGSGEEAIEAVKSLQPDLVLMDIRLGGAQDGIQTAQQIRTLFHVPVMYVTAHADGETLRRARVTEPFGYIVKPFHSIDFRPQIEMALWKHQMEQKLRSNQAWLSAICHNVADALISSDSNGKIAFMNGPASALTGWDLNEAIGKPLLEVFQVFEEATGLPVVHPLDAIYDGRKIATEARTFKLRNRTGDDSALVEARLSANYDADSLLGTIVIFREVSDRRKAEEQQRQQQKMNAVSRMATGLGKEFDDLQRRMDGAISQLAADNTLTDDAKNLVGDIGKHAAHQQSVVEQLIRLGGTDPGSSATVDVNDVVTALAPELRKSLGVRRPLGLLLQRGIPVIRVDEQRLKETILRLVVNARNSMPDGGRAEISTTALETEGGKTIVRLTVWDSGKGIRADARERIFDPYFESRPGIGVPGISLALAWKFTTLSGGTMEVESAFDEGTAYLLNFPAADCPGESVRIPEYPDKCQTVAVSA